MSIGSVNDGTLSNYTSKFYMFTFFGIEGNLVKMSSISPPFPPFSDEILKNRRSKALKVMAT